MKTTIFATLLVCLCGCGCEAKIQFGKSAATNDIFFTNVFPITHGTLKPPEPEKTGYTMSISADERYVYDDELRILSRQLVTNWQGRISIDYTIGFGGYYQNDTKRFISNLPPISIGVITKRIE